MIRTTKYKPALAAFLSLFAALTFCTSAHSIEAHRKIKGAFNTNSDVTRACLKCHKQQAVEVLQSTHWAWERERIINGKPTKFGKKNALSNFAIDATSNPDRCLGCHVSNTGPDINFDRPDPQMVDCLICHDTTGTYHREDSETQQPSSREDLSVMARNVGLPTPDNCINCHFIDCGLPSSDNSGDTSARNFWASNDIHFHTDGISLTCQDCHVRSSGHSFTRKINRMNTSSPDQGCASCHTNTPHNIGQLNRHTAVITCQTCHIPMYAEKEPAIISWNWIMTGKGKRIYQNNASDPTLIQDENGFTSATQILPVYRWDNGSEELYTRGQRIKPEELTLLQQPSKRDANSKISPFRVIYSTQLYDTKYRYLVSPSLQPSGTTFFSNSDWEPIARKGMEAIVLPFSGQFAFAPTATFRRVNHGVVPTQEALGCVDCHGSSSRMPWKELGYNQDPWSGVSRLDSESEGLGTNHSQQNTLKLQPVKESLIPTANSF